MKRSYRKRARSTYSKVAKSLSKRRLNVERGSTHGEIKGRQGCGCGRKVPSVSRRGYKGEQNAIGKTSKEVKYLTKEAVKEIHLRVLSETEKKTHVHERPHILNPGMLEMALELPKKRLYGRELYPDLFEKAAVLMRELIVGHVFEAANKRTGYICAVVFLRQNGYAVTGRAEEAEDLTIGIATGRYDIKYIAKWLKKHSRRISNH